MWFCFSFITTKMRNIFKVEQYKHECILIDQAVKIFNVKVFKEIHPQLEAILPEIMQGFPPDLIDSIGTVFEAFQVVNFRKIQLKMPKGKGPQWTGVRKNKEMTQMDEMHEKFLEMAEQCKVQI